MGKTSVAVFLKEPRPGSVKTRLARSLGPRAAAEIYRRFVEDTLEWLGRFSGARRFLYYTPPGAAAECARLSPRVGAPFRLVPQSSGSLGRRLARAFEDLLPDGTHRAVILGTDSPLLDSRLLRAAIRALETADLVLGPARDGGYYLIGLKRPRFELFESIPWSTSSVLRRTLEQAAALDLSTTCLETLSDVDTFADLRRLKVELVEAWRQVARGRRRDFPLRTFRHLSWQVPQLHERSRLAITSGTSDRERGRNRRKA